MPVLGGRLAGLHLPECGDSLQEDVLEDVVIHRIEAAL